MLFSQHLPSLYSTAGISGSGKTYVQSLAHDVGSPSMKVQSGAGTAVGSVAVHDSTTSGTASSASTSARKSNDTHRGSCRQKRAQFSTDGVMRARPTFIPTRAPAIGTLKLSMASVHGQLSSKKVVVDEDTGLKRVVVEGVCEQRLSNLVHAVLIGLCCFIPGVLPGLKQIPLSVLDGIFLFMGFGCFGGNGFIGRLLLAVTDPLKRASALGTSKELEGVLATEEGRTEVHRCLFDPAVDWG